jgi:site-specific DNA-methyltransferase (adenine-specific)
MRKEVIGDCELYLGDCLDILPALGRVDAVVTDPPYSSGGRQQQAARNIFAKAGGVSKETRADDWFLGDNMGSDTYVRWMRRIGAMLFNLNEPGGAAYVFTDWRQYTNIVTTFETCRWTLRSVIVWDKNRGGAMGSWWRNNHEWICAFVKGRPRPLPHGSFFNTWKGGKPRGGEHPTEKPVGLMKYLAETVPEGGTILDPFMGSGTTGAACVETGRKFVGIEISEKYFDIACKRISKAVKELRGRLDYGEAIGA